MVGIQLINRWFSLNYHDINILENTTGLMESQFLQEAHDPKNDGIENPADKFPIYYFIDCEIVHFIFSYLSYLIHLF